VLIEVDVNTVKRNIREARRVTGGRVSGVVKAAAYGHGLGLIRRIENDLDTLAVSNIEEAFALRDLGVRAPIHVLGSVLNSNKVAKAIKAGIILTITDPATYKIINSGVAAEVKINTGMNRLGLTAEEFKMIRPNINLRGIFTHFADGADIDFCNEQLAEFEKAEKLCPKGVIRHCCATNYKVLPKKFYKDGIRLGLGMYGNAMKAGGRVVQINRVRAGDRVGYGNNIVSYNTRTATLDIGYGDGIPRSLSNGKGKIDICGYLYHIVGTVCMDMVMVDIGNADIALGEKAYYIRNNINSVADAANTIPYEIMTALNLRATYKYT